MAEHPCKRWRRDRRVPVSAPRPGIPALSAADPVDPVAHPAPPRRLALKRALRSTLRRGARAGLAGTLLMSLGIRTAQAHQVVAVRIWPATDYTRVTLELDEPLRASHQLIEDPPRLVVDLEGGQVDDALRELVAKVRADDPYIRQVRVGQYKPDVIRIVLDLKAPISPQIFSLNPVEPYRYRLVLDLFPVASGDPLQAILAGAYQADRDPLASLLARPSDTAGGAPSPSSPTLTAALEAARSGTGSNANPDPSAQSGRTGRAGAGTGVGADPRAGSGGAPGAGAGSAAGAAAAGASGAASGGTGPHRETTTLASASRSAPRRGPGSVTRLVTVAIDPGHGGEDPGAIGRRGTREKDVVLAIGRQLAVLINREPNMRAFLTRDADFFVPLGVRVEKARRVQADLFISIHADAFVNDRARGASVFVLSGSGASSTAARWLAARENRSDLIGGVRLTRSSSEVARMLLDMSTASQIRDSGHLGRAVLAELGGLGSLHKADIEQAGFAVLKAPDIPSILIETAFITNAAEEKRLADPRHQAKIATAIFRGVRSYFVKNPPAPRSRPT